MFYFILQIKFLTHLKFYARLFRVCTKVCDVAAFHRNLKYTGNANIPVYNNQITIQENEFESGKVEQLSDTIICIIVHLTHELILGEG